MNDMLQPDVAIVGAGPAGLGAAIELRARGVEHVMVFEREAEAGGIPRHCAHPPYGIREFGRVLDGPTYARRLVALAEQGGVDIRTGHSVVELQPGGRLVMATDDGSVTVQAHRTILATGAREKPRAARLVSGERPTGIMNTGALQGCIHLRGLRPFDRPVIVGTELVGLSAVWTCVRHGIRPVAVIEAADRPIARWPLGLFPRLLNIPVLLNSRISAIIGRSTVERVRVATDAGHSTELACDGVLFTGQFLPEASLMRMSHLEVDAASGGPTVDQFGRCTDGAYFAAGNVLRPIESAGWCHREGRSVGAAVARDLAGTFAMPPGSVRVVCGTGIKLAVPQLVGPAPSDEAALRSIQVRAASTRRSRLTVRAGAKILWSRRCRARLENRILIPLESLRVPADATSITVSFDPDSQGGEH